MEGRLEELRERCDAMGEPWRGIGMSLVSQAAEAYEEYGGQGAGQILFDLEYALAGLELDASKGELPQRASKDGERWILWQ